MLEYETVGVLSFFSPFNVSAVWVDPFHFELLTGFLFPFTHLLAISFVAEVFRLVRFSFVAWWPEHLDVGIHPLFSTPRVLAAYVDPFRFKLLTGFLFPFTHLLAISFHLSTSASRTAIRSSFSLSCWARDSR